MPECPYCKIELEIDTPYDQETEISDIIVFNIGYCPKCGKFFKWRDHFTFSHFTDLKEEG